MPSSGLCKNYTHVVYIYTCRQNKHIHKIDKLLKFCFKEILPENPRGPQVSPCNTHWAPAWAWASRKSSGSFSGGWTEPPAAPSLPFSLPLAVYSEDIEHMGMGRCRVRKATGDWEHLTLLCPQDIKTRPCWTMSLWHFHQQKRMQQCTEKANHVLTKFLSLLLRFFFFLFLCPLKT